MLIIEKFKAQIENAKQISDSETFIALMKMGEFFTKVSALAIISSLKDGKERTKYRYLYEVVSADGIGTWAKVIDQIVGTAVSVNVEPQFSFISTELGVRQTEGLWGYDVIKSVYECKQILTNDSVSFNFKIRLKDWYRNFAELRNDYAHNRVSISDYKLLIPHLEKSLSIFVDNFSLFKLQWLYVYKTTSGILRSVKLNHCQGVNESFHTADFVDEGIYICLDQDISLYVNLLVTDLNLNDFYVPNGRFTDKKFELISYLTSDTLERKSNYFHTPLESLPKSETNGLEELELINSCFTNIPKVSRKYIERTEIEDKLLEALIDVKRWPIISLRGRGGIGKTSTALEVLRKVADGDRYQAIIWFSARDIDFNDYGKPINVEPRILTKDDICNEYLELIEHPDRKKKEFNRNEFFTQQLANNLFGTTLFVFDNFETVDKPVEIFEWLETFIELPNRILITTRHREFTTDKQIEVDGMKFNEYSQLAVMLANEFQVTELINEAVLSKIYKVSQGHPYVVKILIGEIASTQSVANLNRVFENKDQILQALFERTYDKLKPLSQKVFQVLCNWRSIIPELAIEAIITCNPSDNDDEMYEYDIQETIDELRVLSFIEIINPRDEYKFINVPITASIFGLSKYKANPNKAEISFYTKLLHDFGASQTIHVKDGIEPRIRYFINAIKQKVSNEEDFETQYLDIVSFIARRYNKTKLLLSELYGEKFNNLKAEKKYLDEYLRSEINDETKQFQWDRLAKLYLRNNKYDLYYQTLIEKYDYKDCSIFYLSDLAFEMSKGIQNRQFDQVKKEVRYEILGRLIKMIETNVGFAKITGLQLGRLAWLYIHIGKPANAKKLAHKGLSFEYNKVCKDVIEKLNKTASL